MHTQDADVGSLIQKRKVLSNKEKLSLLLDQVTPQDQLKDAVKGKIPKHFKSSTQNCGGPKLFSLGLSLVVTIKQDTVQLHLVMVSLSFAE